jgi:hypothetical protein
LQDHVSIQDFLFWATDGSPRCCPVLAAPLPCADDRLSRETTLAPSLSRARDRLPLVPADAILLDGRFTGNSTKEETETPIAAIICSAETNLADWNVTPEKTEPRGEETIILARCVDDAADNPPDLNAALELPDCAVAPKGVRLPLTEATNLADCIAVLEEVPEDLSAASILPDCCKKDSAETLPCNETPPRAASVSREENAVKPLLPRTAALAAADRDILDAAEADILPEKLMMPETNAPRDEPACSFGPTMDRAESNIAGDDPARILCAAPILPDE